jgi:hypothetical protein
MTIRHKLDPAEAARISRDLQDTLDFFAEVIDDPRLADHIPSGSMLDFRVIRMRDERVRLTAFRPSRSAAPWSARVTSRKPLSEDPAVTPPTRAPEVWNLVTTGATAHEAFDALEAALRTHAADHHPLPARQRR